MLSAVGIHLADIVAEAQEPVAEALAAPALPGLQARLHALQEAAEAQLVTQGFSLSQISIQHFLNLR